MVLTDFQKVYIKAYEADVIVNAVVASDGSKTIALQPTRPYNLNYYADAGDSGITAGLITVTGTNLKGDTIVEVIDLASGLTQSGTKTFTTVVSVVISGLVGAGAGDRLTIKSGQYTQPAVGRVTFESVVVPAVLDQAIYIIDGVDGDSTVNVATLKASIVEKTYKYDCSLKSGLRIKSISTTPFLVTYNQ